MYVAARAAKKYHMFFAVFPDGHFPSQHIGKSRVKVCGLSFFQINYNYNYNYKWKFRLAAVGYYGRPRESDA